MRFVTIKKPLFRVTNYTYSGVTKIPFAGGYFLIFCAYIIRLYAVGLTKVPLQKIPWGDDINGGVIRIVNCPVMIEVYVPARVSRQQVSCDCIHYRLHFNVIVVTGKMDTVTIIGVNHADLGFYFFVKVRTFI